VEGEVRMLACEGLELVAVEEVFFAPHAE